MLAVWYVMRFFKPAAIVSEHVDGAWAAAALEALNFTIFRGSSNRGGVRALKQLLKFLREQPIPVAAFAADGPQGPRRKLKPGTTMVAVRLKGPVIPFGVKTPCAWRLNSWDRFIIPWPGSKVIIDLGPPLYPPPTLNLREQNQWLEEVCRRHQEQVESDLNVREHSWQHPAFLPLRIPAMWLYAVANSIYHKLYDHDLLKPRRLPKPVISVGNIEVGGTGKTVFVEALARWCISQGYKPAVLTRGYRRKAKESVIIHPQHTSDPSVEQVGDEALLLSQNLPGVPIIVGKDRYRTALKALDSLDIDLFLLDDGFQHRRLYRDLDLVLWSNPPQAQRRLIPWGVLRESERSFSRADLVIPMEAGKESPLAPKLVVQPAVNSRGEERPLEDFSGKAGAFAGIGHPGKFFRMLDEYGIPVVKRFAFPDHCRYHNRRLELLNRQRVHYWITTQKDFVKLPAEFLAEKEVWYVPIAFEFPMELEEKLRLCLRRIEAFNPTKREKS